jgi:hypothetical protein
MLMIYIFFLLKVMLMISDSTSHSHSEQLLVHSTSMLPVDGRYSTFFFPNELSEEVGFEI